jgi:hypothetical protein
MEVIYSKRSILLFIILKSPLKVAICMRQQLSAQKYNQSFFCHHTTKVFFFNSQNFTQEMVQKHEKKVNTYKRNRCKKQS